MQGGKTQKHIHSKQERIQVRDGAPALAELTHGVPTIRYIKGKGLYFIIKYKSKMYSIELQEGIN